MALTPEDVVNKRFQPTKFREGYDQDEVDDFLDEVVVELRRLGQENEDLRQRLIASESRIAELQRSSVPVTGEQAAQAPISQLSYPTAQTDVSAVDPSNTNNLLQLARRLHEEHVREGVEKRDALIAEGQSTASRVISEAETRSQELVGDAESRSREVLADAETRSREVVAEAEGKRREVLEQLTTERTGLERRIDDLRTFERDYRQKLKSYIEGQLHELDGEGASEPQPASAQGFGSN